VTFQVLHALRYVHDCGLLHAGIKPENILFDAGGNVRLSDLGMGEIILYDHPDLRQILLPPIHSSYLSPEILADPSDMAPACDLYALGIVFYEMLTGVVPVPGAPTPSQVQPELPDLADELYLGLTQDNPADRYLSADDALEDIYRTDALHWFMDPRDALFFLGSVAGAGPVDGGVSAPQSGGGLAAVATDPGVAPEAYETAGYGQLRPPPAYADEYVPDDMPLSSTQTWEYPVVRDEFSDEDDI